MAKKKTNFINGFEIELTNHCNANCVFCPRKALTRSKGFMSWDVFKKIIERIPEFGAEFIIFSGFGEPLMHPDCLDYIKYLHDNQPKVRIELITNGTFLTPERTDKLKNITIDELTISFSCESKAAYEKTMRNIPSDQIINNLSYLSKNGGDLLNKTMIRPVLTKIFDYPQWTAMQNILAHLGFRPKNFDKAVLCINRGGYLPPGEVWDEQFLKEKGVEFYPPENISCLMWANTLQLAWNGDVLLCCCDINKNTDIGNITTSKIDDLLAKILYYRHYKYKPEICYRCNAPFVFNGFKKYD
ncbi:MAG: radical SAM protein [Candidatus Margulisiibacteriota bacterium]